MRAESITVNETRISYRHNRTGHREVALLLHGLGGDHRGLLSVAAGLHDVDVVIPDLPGYGDSAPLTVPHSLANYAATVEALRVALDLGPVHLIGHSLGASIALLHAATYAADTDSADSDSAAQPAALRSLTLLNPVSTANNVTANLGKLYYRVAAALPARAARFWLASKPAVYIADIMIMVSKDKAVRRRILDEDYQNYGRANVPAMIESFLSYYDTDFEAQAAHITAETLLITGDADRIAPVASVTALAAAIPSATLRVLPGAGHLLPMETPADLVEPLAGFLRGTVADPTESV